MRETVSRKDASPWAIETWAVVKDVLSNERGWAILMDAADELSDGEYHNRLAKAYEWLLAKGWKQAILEEQIEAMLQEITVLGVKFAASEERAMLLLDAKNHWAHRARVAEGRQEELEKIVAEQRDADHDGYWKLRRRIEELEAQVKEGPDPRTTGNWKDPHAIG